MLELISNRNEWEYDDLLTEIGFGKAQLSLVAISGLLTITSIAPQVAIGIISIVSECEFRATQAEKGIMLASCVSGIFLSTYFWGYICDVIGRRKVLLYSTFLSVFFQLITLFLSNFWFFNIINFFVGISLGGISAAIYAYLSELTVNKYRAVVINYSTMFVSFTSIYVPAISWLILSNEWSLTLIGSFEFRPWRLIIFFSLLPGLAGALWLLKFPESPKLLMAQKRMSEALVVVDWISRYNTGKPLSSITKTDQIILKQETTDCEILENHDFSCSVFAKIWKASIVLFEKPHNKNFIISVVAVGGMFFSSSVQVWFPEIVNRTSTFNSTLSGTICEVLDESFANKSSNASNPMFQACDTIISSKTYIDNIVIGTAFLIGFIIQGFVINYFGRKNILMCALVIAATASFLLNFTTNAYLLLIFFCLFLLMPGLSISIMLGAVVDFVPTYMRGKAVSLTLTLGRLGIIVSSNLIGVMLEPFCGTTFHIFTIAILVCLILVYYLPFK